MIDDGLRADVQALSPRPVDGWIVILKDDVTLQDTQYTFHRTYASALRHRDSHQAALELEVRPVVLTFERIGAAATRDDAPLIF